jgi:selenocysteine lyase/cysteine desulfurase
VVAAPASDAPALAARLLEQRILVSARHGLVRVSPHFYNDESDLQALERAL